MSEPETRPASSQNDITGDHIITKASSESYRNGWDRIFGKKDKEESTSERNELPD